MPLKFLLLFFIISGFAFYTKAQDTLYFNKKNIGKHLIGVEFGGTGMLYSAYYQRNFLARKCSFQSLRIGGSYLLNDVSDINDLSIWESPLCMPIEYSGYLGTGKWKLFGGAGVVALFNPHPSPASYKDRQEYKRLYNINPDSALAKNSARYNPAFDLAYVAKIGIQYISKKKMSFYSYINCFYFRDNLKWFFQPIWACIGFGYKIY